MPNEKYHVYLLGGNRFSKCLLDLKTKLNDPSPLNLYMYTLKSEQMLELMTDELSSSYLHTQEWLTITLSSMSSAALEQAIGFLLNAKCTNFIRLGTTEQSLVTFILKLKAKISGEQVVLAHHTQGKADSSVIIAPCDTLPLKENIDSKALLAIYSYYKVRNYDEFTAKIMALAEKRQNSLASDDENTATMDWLFSEETGFMPEETGFMPEETGFMPEETGFTPTETAKLYSWLAALSETSEEISLTPAETVEFDSLLNALAADAPPPADSADPHSLSRLLNPSPSQTTIPARRLHSSLTPGATAADTSSPARKVAKLTTPLNLNDLAAAAAVAAKSYPPSEEKSTSSGLAMPLPSFKDVLSRISKPCISKLTEEAGLYNLLTGPAG